MAVNTGLVNKLVSTVDSSGSFLNLSKGVMRLNNELHANVNHGEGKSSTSWDLQTRFELTRHRVDTRFVDGYSSLQGINRKFITTSGVIDADQCLQEMTRTLYGRRITNNELKIVSETMSVVDCHESFIMNMLISWFKAYLGRKVSPGRSRFNIKRSAVREGEVRSSLTDVFDSEAIEIELRAPVRRREDYNISLRYRDASNYWSSNAVLLYNGSDPIQEAFYMAHIFGRDGTPGTTFDISLEAFKGSRLLLDPVDRKRDLFDWGAEERIDWSDSEKIWSWMIDYVLLNRLTMQFNAVVELFTTLAFHPVPEYAQGIVWERYTLKVTLPAFYPSRGRLHALLEGDPYILESFGGEACILSSRNVDKWIVEGAILNYYMWLGLFEVFSEELRGMVDWKQVMSARTIVAKIGNQAFLRSAAVSVITGMEVSTYMTPALNVTLSPSREMLSDVNIRGANSAVGILSVLPARVSGYLVLGSVSRECRHLNHLASTVTAVPSNMPDPETVRSFMVIYGLFQQTMSVVDRHQTTVPVRLNLIREAVAKTYEITDDYETVSSAWFAVSSHKRTKTLLPTMQYVIANDIQISMAVMRPTISCAGAIPKMTNIQMNLKEKKQYTYKVRSTLGQTSLVIPVAGMSFERDFHDVQPQQLPMGPIEPEVQIET